MKIFLCEHCRRIVIEVKGGAPMKCCGVDMVELVPNTSDGAGEKHVPVVVKDGNHVVVSVGEVEHPMLEEHFIEWIILETNKGYQFKHLSPNEKPVAEFELLDGEEVLAAYEHCNLHGLWKA